MNHCSACSVGIGSSTGMRQFSARSRIKRQRHNHQFRLRHAARKARPGVKHHAEQKTPDRFAAWNNGRDPGSGAESTRNLERAGSASAPKPLRAARHAFGMPNPCPARQASAPERQRPKKIGGQNNRRRNREASKNRPEAAWPAQAVRCQAQWKGPSKKARKRFR